MTDLLLGTDLSPAGSLVWTAPQWVIITSVAAALLVWGATLLGSRTPWQRVLEAVCVALGLAGLVAALAGPTWVEEAGRVEPGRNIVLVDASSSMATLEDGRPRSEGVARVLAHVQRQLGEVEIYHWGEHLGVGEPAAYDQPGTDLEGAFDAISERVAGERLQSLVLITDGLDRGLLRRRYQREETPPAPILPGPLTIYPIGDAREVIDLAVRSVDSGGYAFIRSPFTITARVEGVGMAGRTVTATLQKDGAPLTQRSVRLDEEGRGEVRFEVVPDEAGRFTYSVHVPVYEGDAVPANNVMPLVVSVVRDRIRVLQVAGAPSWDVKFMRRFLKGDPSVQLVSFFILRTTDDSSSYSERELSLIAFPYTRLFDEDLWSFDVVVFHNFDHAPYFQYASHQLLSNLKRYVEQGGSLVMVGGDRSFGLGGYAGTPLADVLPVEITRSEVPDTARFQPRLTAEGARHPITRLAGDPVENAAWWERLVPLDGTNVVLGARHDATVLLEHPTRKGADGRPLPVLAVREVGEGRTMALTVDSSWRWSLSEAAEGRGNQAYLRFWKNAIRWLMKDSTADRVTVDTPRENYAVGDEVRVIVRARDPGFSALSGADVEVEIRSEAGSTVLAGRTDLDGELVLPFTAERRGTHRVVARVQHGGATVGEQQTVFAVTTRDPELDEVAPDQGFLRWLAASTGGVAYGPGELGPVLRDPTAGRTVADRRETPLWRAPIVALWAGFFLGVAWIVRRRSGLR